MTRAQQALLSGTALAVFRLNSQFLSAAEDLARPAGVTASGWQVLGAVLDAPQSVAGIARTMGITRQSVQRNADLLVDRGLAEYLPNPAHRRAKLLALTEAGRAAIRRIGPAQAALARRLADALGTAELEATRLAMQKLSQVLESIAPD